MKNIYLYILIFVIIISVILFLVLRKTDDEKKKNETEQQFPALPSNLTTIPPTTLVPTTTMMPTTMMPTTLAPTTMRHITTLAPTTMRSITTLAPTMTPTMVPTTTMFPFISDNMFNNSTTNIPTSYPPEIPFDINNYINIFKNQIGYGVDLRNSKTSDPFQNQQGSPLLNINNFNINNYAGQKINYSKVSQTGYESLKDYSYSLSTNVDASATFPIQFLSVKTEMQSRSNLNITENTNIQNLTYSFINQFAQIDLDESFVFDNNNIQVSNFFQEQVQSKIKNAPLYIEEPEIQSSWLEYKQFFDQFGTHMIAGITLGSKFDIYYSSEYVDKSRISDLKIKACLEISAEEGSGGVCAGIGQEDINRVNNSNIQVQTAVYGGDSNLRSEILSIKSPSEILKRKDLLYRFMVSGEKSPSIMDYRYIPIWDVISKINSLSCTKSLSDEQIKAGFKCKILKFVQNLKTYYEFTLKYKFNEDTFYEIPPNRNFQLISRNTGSNIGTDILFTDELGTPRDTSVGGNWGPPANYLKKTELNPPCPDKYAKDGDNCFPYADSGVGGRSYGNGGGYAAWNMDKCQKENPQGCFWNASMIYPNCQKGFYNVGGNICVRNNEDRINNISSQQIQFVKSDTFTKEKDEFLLRTKKSIDAGGTPYYLGILNENKGRVQIADKPAIYNISENDSTNAGDNIVWKMDMKGRLHPKSNYNLCLQTSSIDDKIYLLDCSTDPLQRFYLK